MTTLLVVVTGIVVLSCAVWVWALLAASARADEDAAYEAEVLGALAAERVRTEMRERLLRARPHHRDDEVA